MYELCFDKSKFNKAPCEISFFLLLQNFNVMKSTIIITISSNILILTSISVFRCQVSLFSLTQIEMYLKTLRMSSISRLGI